MGLKEDLAFEKKVQAGIDKRNAAAKQEADMLKTHDPIPPSEQKYLGGEKWIPKDIVARRKFLGKYEK